jgi:hypothetical protein
MWIRKYKMLLVLSFISIFAAKMIISGAPVFFSHFDGRFMNSVIMQLETENHGDDAGKSSVKFSEQKLFLQKFDLTYVCLELEYGVTNSFIEHSRRYVDPYHPLVPTPPPNRA